MNQRSIVLIIHNVRSCHNVGSLLRTADGIGVKHIYLTGYTPFPEMLNDPRMPHLAEKISKQINKTALGAEKSVSWTYNQSISEVIKKLKDQDYQIIALEQTHKSKDITEFDPLEEAVIIVGAEVEGIDQAVLDLSDLKLFIPMLGQKESFNVSIAGAIALYHLRYY